MKKLLDTNILLDYPQILDKKEDFVISIYVVQELDKLKNDQNTDKAVKARNAIRKIKENMDSLIFDETYLSSKSVDEALLDIAKVNKYILITNDYNLQIRCKIREVDYEDYCPLISTISDTWKTEIVLSAEEMAYFYENKQFPNSIKINNNNYVFIKNDLGKIVDKFFYRNNIFESLKYKNIESNYDGIIKPRNLEQECAFHMIQDNQIKIKTLTGPFGSGKSCLMILGALMLLEKGKFNKIVYVRNNIEVKDTVELGSLPGTDLEKLYPYLMPIADHIGGTFGLDRMILEHKLEPIHLGFMRGRDIKNSIIYVTEAQNLTIDQMKLLIGRVAEGSELWIDGDLKQVDRKIFKDNNGLKALINTLNGNRLFAHVHLIKSERSEVSALADLLD